MKAERGKAWVQICEQIKKAIGESAGQPEIDRNRWNHCWSLPPNEGR